MAPGGYSMGESLSVDVVTMHLVATVDDHAFTVDHARTLADMLDARDLHGDDHYVTVGFSCEALGQTIGSFFSTSSLHAEAWSQIEGSLAPLLVSEEHHAQFGRTPEDIAGRLAYGMNDAQPWWRTSFGGEWNMEDFLPITSELVWREMRPDGNITDDFDGFLGKGARDGVLEILIAAHFPDVERDIIARAVGSMFYVQEVETPLPPAHDDLPVFEAGMIRYDIMRYLGEVRGFVVTIQNALPVAPPAGKLDEYGSVRALLKQFLTDVEGWLVMLHNPKTTSIDRPVLSQWAGRIEELRCGVRAVSSQSALRSLGESLDQMIARFGTVSDLIRAIASPARGVATAVAAGARTISDTRLPAVPHAAREGARRVMSAPRHPVAMGIVIVVGLLAFIGAVSAFVFARDDE